MSDLLRQGLLVLKADFLVTLLCYFVEGVNVFDEPPVNVPPTLYTPPKRFSVAPLTDVTPYINVCDVFVNSGDESNTVALFTLFGHL